MIRPVVAAACASDYALSRLPAIVLVASAAGVAAPHTATLTLELKDFAALSIPGNVEGSDSRPHLARVHLDPAKNLRTWQAVRHRHERPYHILDKTNHKRSRPISISTAVAERPLHSFDRLYHDPGYSSGISQFQFDPDYQRNGKFYTVHMEGIGMAGSQRPDLSQVPGLALGAFGYEPTAAIATPGPITYESILIEWTDTDLQNLTFEGTAREVLRVQLNHRIHPLGEVVFHPTARRGDPEWRVMYVGVGDGGSGETRTVARPNPQRLDTLVGKILRIIPDPNEHVATSTLSDNGRYRVPIDNPFVAKPGAKKEIWAYGLRNPHRLSWAADPADARRQHLIAAVVGLRTWEMVNIIRKGANYGYSQREGNQLLQPDNAIAPLPAVDKIAVQIGDKVTDEAVVPAYPVIQYGHVPAGGDGIGSG